MQQALKKNGVRVFSFLLFAVLLLALLPVNAFALSDEAAVVIDVEQIFTNDSNDSDPSSTFSYILIPENSGNPMPMDTDADGVFRFDITGSDKISAGPIVFTGVGEYGYTVRQTVSSPAAGYAYDPAVYTVRVIIQNTASGLSPKIVLMLNEAGEKVDSVIFRNGYDVKFTHTFDDPPVRKVIKGNPPKTPEFTFVMTADMPDYPMPAGSRGGKKELTVSGGGYVEFGVIEFDRTGIYTYRIAEKNTGLSDFTYDSTVYTVTYAVTVENEWLSSERIITSNDGDKTFMEAVFTNTYNGGSHPGPDAPKTGDSSHTLLWTVLMLLSVSGILYLLLANRNKRRRTEASERGEECVSDLTENSIRGGKGEKEAYK